MIGYGRKKRNVFERFRDILTILIIENEAVPPHRVSRLMGIGHKNCIRFYFPVLIKNEFIEIIKCPTGKRSAYNIKITDLGVNIHNFLNWFIDIFNIESETRYKALEFEEKLKLIKKLRTNVEIKPKVFLCNCGDVFYNEDDFKEHLKKEHNKTNPKGGYKGYR